MKYRLVVTPEAQQDVEEALAYYLKIRVFLAQNFIETVQEKYNNLENAPHHYSFFGNQKRLRSVSVQKFPYLIIFQIEGDTVYIFGLHNTHQNPETILKRL